MGVNYKLNSKEYAKILQLKRSFKERESSIDICFYEDKIIVEELDIRLELDRNDIKEVIQKEYTIIETSLGYKILILDNVIKNKEKFLEYLLLYKNEKKINEEKIRIDTINNISTIKLDRSKIEFNLEKIDKIYEDEKNIYFKNKSIMFENIYLPKCIFESEEDKNKFLESILDKNTRLFNFIKKYITI